MPATDSVPVFAVDRPYPGLRPFEAHEAFLFHGRDDHTRALLERLATERFLAVVGSSGSGKSSLVRAGLLPALYRGYLVGASSRWRIAVMRPGNAPLDELASALAARGALGADAPAIRGTIGRTSVGLATVVAKATLAEQENVLLVVDQFEELFRFEKERRHLDGGAEASLFVQCLIEASGSFTGRLYVVLTMRSDYLGQCARFAGLPEALNRGQYLIPHLDRDERLEAIEKPPLLANVGIKPALVQHLLNDLGDDPAQLPVLQHALMRTFERLRASGAREMDFQHYREAGGIAHALDQHANTIVESLPPSSRPWVEKLFRCLTTLEGGRAVRRPARLDRIHEVLGISGDAEARKALSEVIRAFADPDNSLLVSSTGLELTGDSVIDISHESLIRNWHRLKEWLADEHRSAEWLRSLAEDTLRHQAGEAGLWRDPELGRVLALKSAGGWNAPWARQYVPEGEPTFGQIEKFLDESARCEQQARDEKEARRQKEIDDARRIADASAKTKRAYAFLSVALTLLLLALLAGGLWWVRDQRTRAREAREAAEREELNAQLQLQLNEQINGAAAQQALLTQRLQQADAQLKAAAESGSANTAALLVQMNDLKRQVEASTAAERRARQDLEKAANNPNAAKGEYSNAFKQISDLQGELRRTRDERDRLQRQVDVYEKARGQTVGRAARPSMTTPP
jgi:energy-coupling factor transporter ATP-binding protein EcfA2